MKYCLYYQAKINKSLTWFFVATFRSFEHVGFDRTFDAQEGIFEFFVPESMEKYFLEALEMYKQINIASDLKKLPNRFNEDLSS